MNKKWQVRVREVRTWIVEVEAEDWSSADDAAMVVELNQDCKVEKEADVLRQIGEPWVYGGWYDLHGPGDVIVCKPSYGNWFTEAQVEELGRRLKTLGLKVLESWNGAGCNSVSFRCGDRVGTGEMTEGQSKVLLAPMPAEADELDHGGTDPGKLTVQP